MYALMHQEPTNTHRTSPDAALRVLEDLRGAGLEPDSESYKYVLLSLARCGEHDQVGCAHCERECVCVHVRTAFRPSSRARTGLRGYHAFPF